MTRPTPRGAALVVVAVATYAAARVLGTWELYAVALAFTAMVCVSWGLVALGGRRLQVFRDVAPSSPVAGDPLTFSFRIRSESILPGLQVTLHDAIGELGGAIGRWRSRASAGGRNGASRRGRGRHDAASTGCRPCSP